VIDIGGGDSRLVDHLLVRGLTCLSVLDISGAALTRAQNRLGPQHHLIRWIEADVTADWRVPPVDIWHDRAVFHFLTDECDRVAYVEHLRENLKSSGSVIIATFALDGPAKCSGLPVIRYSPDSLAAELGADFTLVDTQVEQHQTPARAHQSFCYTRFRRSR
jgi:hypothetical protein